MTNDQINLTGHFLIAMPSMDDPTFKKTLTLVCEHTDEGALGLIVNRPIEMTVGMLFDNLDLPIHDNTIEERFVLVGGPVQTERGFVLHRPLGKWQTTLTISEEVGLTTSRDILLSFSNNSVPDEWAIMLGYAGWAAGQLESEISQNAWLTAPADFSIVFDLPPEERFEAAIGLFGTTMASISGVAGHA